MLPVDVAAQTEPDVTKPIRVTATLHGRLVDLNRAMTHETAPTGDAREHVMVPLGLDTNDKIHVVLWSAQGDEAEQLRKHVGHLVVIEGALYSQKGLSAVVVESITRNDEG
jgi:hypothetical protein